MRFFWKLFLFIGLQGFILTATSAPIKITSVHYSNQITHSRVIFNTSSPAIHHVFLLANPARLVVDFKQAQLKGKLKQPIKKHPYFKKIRSSKKANNELRIVVDLKQTVIQSNFNVAPNKNGGHRFIVDVVKVSKKSSAITKKKLSKKSSQSKKKKSSFISKKNNAVVIAIDAGHGGIDSGARGPQGTQEKKVVFAIAKKLAALIDKKPGMKSVLVRQDDTYIKLRKRMEIARKAKADLFISIHADAFKNADVRGASVYILSQNGASSEAAHWLANQENASDLVGGVSLDDKDNLLASVLLDLSQHVTEEASRKVATKVLKYFKEIGRLHKNKVQKAAFAVLKSPDIPSILVETAFISNPFEERNLLSSQHQHKIARAVFKGVVSYFKEYTPTHTRVAGRSK